MIARKGNIVGTNEFKKYLEKRNRKSIGSCSGCREIVDHKVHMILNIADYLDSLWVAALLARTYPAGCNLICGARRPVRIYALDIADHSILYLA